jgi:hypothetical protein
MHCQIEFANDDVGMLRQACRGEVLRLRYCNLFQLLRGILRRFFLRRVL